MTSVIGRLLDEMSWEGNARKYRGGGVGLENVLTAEVFQALDFLPRAAFLGGVLRSAHGAEDVCALAADHAEEALVDVLPGDLHVEEFRIQAQPDAVLSSRASYVFVEAKRIRRSAFQPEQVAREMLLAATHGQGRDPLLLLVLGTPPPISVSRHGRLSIEEAIAVGMAGIESRVGRSLSPLTSEVSVAYLTWGELASRVSQTIDDFRNADPSTHAAVRRVAASLIDAVTTHQ